VTISDNSPDCVSVRGTGALHVSSQEKEEVATKLRLGGEQWNMYPLRSYRFPY
jgi:hypothetical protein